MRSRLHIKRRPACTYAHTNRLFVQMYERTPPASAGLHPSGFSTQPCLSSELCVVVSGACLPHLEHVDRVVVISKPSLTSEVEVAVLSVVQEDVPLLGVDRHVDADCCQILLHRLSDCDMSGTIVGQILDIDRGGVGQLVVVRELIAGILKELARLCDVVIGRAGCARIIVSDCILVSELPGPVRSDRQNQRSTGGRSAERKPFSSRQPAPVSCRQTESC